MIRVVTSAAPVVSRRELLVGEQRGEVLEARSVAGLVGRQLAHRVDADQGGELLVRRRRTARPLDEVALAQGEAPGLAHRHVDVARARKVALGPHEPVALVAQVEQAPHGHELAGVLRLLAPALELALARPGSPLTATAPPSASVARLTGGAAAALLDVLAVLAAALPGRRRGRGGRLLAAVVPAGARSCDRGLGGCLLEACVFCHCVTPAALGLAAASPLRLAWPCPSPFRDWSPASASSTPPGRPSPPASGPGRRRGRPVGALAGAHVDTRGPQDLVDDVGLLASGIRIEGHRLGDRPELVALFAFQDGALELLLCSHQPPH